MMQVVCQWCGHRYTMKREAVANAVAAAQAAKAKHHIEHCPKCRKVLKIPVSDLKRQLPPGSALTAEHGRAGAVEDRPPGMPLPEAPKPAAEPEPENKE